MKRIILGTRGSDLALAQTTMVTEQLKASGFTGEIVREIIKTSGDKRTDIRLADFAKEQIVSQGAFTKELEDALLDGQIDAAVHSLKDLPSRLADGFSLAAVLERAPVEDVLLTRGSAVALSKLPEGATVATSSVRRARTLSMHRPDLKLIDIRGNVPTRLRKLANGEAGDATLLARAGLQRLGFYREGADSIEIESGHVGCQLLSVEDFIPAAGQGAVGIEIRTGSPAAEVLAGIDHAVTATQVAAERAFLFKLGAGCDTPVGVHAQPPGSDGNMTLSAIVFDEQDLAAAPKTGEVNGPAADPEALAQTLMNTLQIETNNA